MSSNEIVIDLALTTGPVTASDYDADAGGGAECVFLGITRPETHPVHGALVALEYDAHESMALDELTRLAEAARARWTPQVIRVHHALGRVPVGETSVVIQVRCAHRAEAFEACRWLIDELKAQVPIWKKECWHTGSTWADGQKLEHAVTPKRSNAP